MGTRLGELVERYGGQLVGDPEMQVAGVATLDRAGAFDISFLSNSKMRAQAARSRAAALILAPADDPEVGASYRGARIVADNPYAYFARTAQLLVAQRAPRLAPGIHPSATVHETARIHPSAHIGPHVTVDAGAVIHAGAVIEAGCYIGPEAVIGDDTRFYPNATFHARCVIGARGIVHSGAVIGDDGFGFALDGGEYVKIPQIGRVVIGDDVDIGSNTTVDRGALEDTIIEDGVKLDNQIQIGHNCHIGAHTAMAGCVGMAGSTRVGKYCTFGGASMINGHIEIGDNVHITASTMVPRSIREPGRYTGYYPMSSNTEFERGAAIVRSLASYRERIRALEKAVETLAAREQEGS
jgi:UDP-3-O-[3-hydroxymyristoyl] glucosamine N-acyltransferase